MGSKTYRARGYFSILWGICHIIISLPFRYRFQYTFCVSAGRVFSGAKDSRLIPKIWWNHDENHNRPSESKTKPIPWRIHAGILIYGFAIDLWICYGFMDPFSVIPIYVSANIKGVYWWDPCPCIYMPYIRCSMDPINIPQSCYHIYISSGKLT
jgi:hypothetical protein